MLREAFLRLKSESPEFFSKLMSYSVYALILLGILGALDWAEVINIPDKLQTILWALFSFFIGTGSTSALPVKSADDGPGGKLPPPPPEPKKP